MCKGHFISVRIVNVEANCRTTRYSSRLKASCSPHAPSTGPWLRVLRSVFAGTARGLSLLLRLMLPLLPALSLSVLSWSLDLTLLTRSAALSVILVFPGRVSSFACAEDVPAAVAPISLSVAVEITPSVLAPALVVVGVSLVLCCRTGLSGASMSTSVSWSGFLGADGSAGPRMALLSSFAPPLPPASPWPASVGSVSILSSGAGDPFAGVVPLTGVWGTEFIWTGFGALSEEGIAVTWGGLGATPPRAGPAPLAMVAGFMGNDVAAMGGLISALVSGFWLLDWNAAWEWETLGECKDDGKYYQYLCHLMKRLQP